MKLNLVPYCNVLAALNRYLQKCCFYTGRVNPAVSLSQQGELLETMKIIRKDTENFEEDNKIVEVNEISDPNLIHFRKYTRLLRCCRTFFLLSVH